MDKKEMLAGILSGKLDMKKSLGKFSTRELAVWLTDYTKELVAFAGSKVVPILNSVPPQSENEGIFTGIFLRIYLWMKSLVILNHSSHIQGVAVALRSMFELFLDLKILANDNNGEYYERYIAFNEIEMFNEARKKVEFYESHFPQKGEKILLQQYISDQARIDRIISNLQRFWPRISISDTKKIHHWHNKDVRGKAADFGTDYEEIYVEFYSRLSSIVHGSGLDFFRKLQKEHFESYYSFCHQTAHKFFIEAIILVAQKMGIDKAWEHEGFYKQLKKVEKDNSWKFLLNKIEQIEEQQKEVEVK
jgi:hypothetical protein